MKKILVTGCSGFLGTHFSYFLKRKNIKFKGVDIINPVLTPNCYFEFINYDLRIPNEIDKILDGVEYVYHFASDIGSLKYINENSENCVKNNLEIDSHLIDACIKKPNINFVYISEPEILNKENLSENLILYFDQKKLIENLLVRLTKKKLINAIIIRLHSTYGKFFNSEISCKSNFTNKLFYSLFHSNTKLNFECSENRCRNFVYILDVVNMLYNSPQIFPSGEKVTYGYLKEYSFLEFYKNTCRIFNKQIQVDFKGEFSEIVFRKPCLRKLKFFGEDIVPKFSLEEGIKHTLESYCEF